MKISEVIKSLTAIADEHGDLDVAYAVFDDGRYYSEPVDYVQVERDDIANEYIIVLE